MRVLLKTEYGSHFYGTNLPTSDRDYKEIYLPSKRTLLLGKPITNKVIQSSGDRHGEHDIDVEKIAIQIFTQSLISGQTFALELAFAPALEKCDDKNFVEFVYKLRSECLTSEISKMTGYCRQQTRIYSQKGRRLECIEAVYNIVKDLPKLSRVKEFHSLLPLNDLLHFETSEDGRQIYTVCGGQHLTDIECGEMALRMQNEINKYGKRAQKTKEDGNTDWKSMMHACRVIFQAKQLLTEHRLAFPFVGENLRFLMAVRQGQIDKKIVGDFLDDSLEEVEKLRNISNLPSRKDVEELAEDLLYDFIDANLTD